MGCLRTVSLCSLALASLLVGCNMPAASKAPEMEAAAASRSPFVGRKAPSFSLLNQSEQQVSLTSLKGQWVVLYFYPKDDTPGCACQATEFTQLLRDFRDMNATVIGVSPDSPASHRKFMDKYSLNIMLLSDTDMETMADYGAWSRYTVDGEEHGRVIRSTFIINPSGMVRYHWPEVIPEGHAERVRQKLTELQG